MNLQEFMQNTEMILYLLHGINASWMILKGTLQKKYGIKVYTIEKDLSLAGAAGEVYDEITGAGSYTVDYLINNAGFGDIGLFAESDWDKAGEDD